MEKQLFECEDYDQSDTSTFVFYDVTLKVLLGEHKIGDRFESASIDYENGLLELWQPNEQGDGSISVGKYKLKLVVEQ